MTPTAFLAYCAAVTLAAATPGPAMFTVITNGVSRGFLRAFMAGVGVAAGDAVLVTLALLGLVALAQTFEWIFLLLKYAGAAYLIFLGIRMWRASATQSNEPRTGEAALSRSFFLGASIALGNPKAILFHASIMPLILNLDTLTFVDGLLVVATVISVNILTMGVYAALAGRASGWFRAPKRMRLMNRFAGSAMIGTGALIAAR
ncbi:MULTISPECIES: LysE family translocator [Mesorhizobium]|uniref:Lysine transporter LysE n=4 Tax=Mesorhizobium TaxID=68287 RepID=A0A1A5IKD0_RHILI|nr:MULTISPECIES: LysE family translocator [Mesorhizobium]MBE1711608.1 LysE family translocator [Mesorhizobium japonicum]MBE1716426.1 LysE family translocator [Mesorhizobium japonicum]MUT24010.1 LysE family translocator [Mesorhizobium japonicum]MUT30801.1 LysE family translocator [Mesorhizobium japonicum]OBP71865.1 lysine transporter LysE [Mesorhizobium loti]